MLEDKIYKDYVDSLKKGEKRRVECLSYLRAQLKNSALDLRKDKLDDSEALRVFQQHKKRLDDTRASIESAGRADLLADVQKELAILNEYLPKPLAESELSAVIAQVVKDTAAVSVKDMGKVMKEVLTRCAGAADPKMVSDLVRQKLIS